MTSEPAVLEITLLKYNQEPTDSLRAQALEALRTVRENLALHVHPTYSRFYSPIDNPKLVYIFGSWPSVEAHQKFLGNDELRNKVLKAQEGILDFMWGLHVPLPDGVSIIHLECDSFS
jgi:hypothetical protein